MHTFIELRILYFLRNFYFSSHADCFSSFIMLFDDFLKKLFYNVLRRFQAVSTFSAWILGSYLLIQEKTRVGLTKRYKFTQKWPAQSVILPFTWPIWYEAETFIAKSYRKLKLNDNESFYSLRNKQRFT